MTRRLRRRLRQDERGNVTIEMVVLFPVLVLLLLSALQFATWYQARTVAIAAAELAARSSATLESTLPGGLAAANRFIHQAGSLKAAEVSGSRTATTTTFTVRGEAIRLIPGVDLRVSQTATLPVERLT